MPKIQMNSKDPNVLVFREELTTILCSLVSLIFLVTISYFYTFVVESLFGFERFVFFEDLSLEEIWWQIRGFERPTRILFLALILGFLDLSIVYLLLFIITLPIDLVQRLRGKRFDGYSRTIKGFGSGSYTFDEVRHVSLNRIAHIGEKGGESFWLSVKLRDGQKLHIGERAYEEQSADSVHQLANLIGVEVKTLGF